MFKDLKAVGFNFLLFLAEIQVKLDILIAVRRHSYYVL